MRKAETTRGLAWLFLIAIAGTAACKKKPGTSEPALPETTTVNTPDLKMRISPNIMAVEIGHLAKGEQVKIIQRSAEMVPIGKLNAHWYKVTSKTGLTGWVYGAHLAVETGEGEPEMLDEKAELRLRTVLPGRWDAALINGTLTTTFVTILSNGTIEFGENRVVKQKGQYQLVFEGPLAKFQVTGLKKPMMTDLQAKIIGDVMIFSAMMGGEEYRLNMAEKTPGIIPPSKPAAASP